MIGDLEQIIAATVREVFKTMLNLAIAPDATVSEVKEGEPQIASSVGFIGRLSGVVYLYCGCAFAGRITSNLLGLSKTETAAPEMVNDAMGEMANMVVGHLKSCLSDRGMPCALTIPSVFRADHFAVGSISSTQRQVFFFRCEASQLVVEVLVKAQSGG